MVSGERERLMRERAQAADGQLWASRDSSGRVSLIISGPASPLIHADPVALDFGPETRAALAELLEAEAADYCETLKAADQRFLAGDEGGDLDPAIKVARAYLAPVLRGAQGERTS